MSQSEVWQFVFLLISLAVRFSSDHEVHIVVSGRAQAFLAKRFENVHRIWGLTLAYEENAIRKWQTVLGNLKGAWKGWPENIRAYFELVEEFRPDVVVSDFESFSYLFAKNHMLPVISVDNMQIINRCKHEPELLRGHEDAFELTKSLVKGKLPGSFHYFITTFFYPEVRKSRTSLVPPILRPEILEARSEEKDHLLVYQTSTTNQSLIPVLKQSKIPCHVYGLRRDLKEPLVDDNLTFMPFSEKGFIDSLRTSRAVLAGGGFTLMSEAVYLRKPMLCVPLEGQFEQILNALYLDKLGYGKYVKQVTFDVIREFLDEIPKYNQALAGYSQDGNSIILQALEETLERAANSKGKWDEITQM